MKVSDTLLCVLSDMHTGSSTALFPRNGYRAEGREENPVLPNDRQLEIHATFFRLMAEVAAARKGRRLIIVNLGDAVDGIHHNSIQESLFKTKDQAGAQIQLMTEFMKKAGFNKRAGDELYYVRGTEVHTGDAEDPIAQELGAVKADSGLYVHEIMEKNINGLNHLFLHHGKARGQGVNEGNALRNWLRDMRVNRARDKLTPVDVVWSGHTHGHMYGNHVERMPDGHFHILHGIICPSWQAKTRYAYNKVPSAVNSVGGVFAKIGVDGSFSVPRFVVQVTKDL